MNRRETEQNRPDSGVQFPDADGFFYSGPSPDVWAGYLKNQLRRTLAPLPQERDGRLAALRKVQSQPGWQWNVSRAEHLEAAEAGWQRKVLADWIFWNDPEEVARLGRLIRAIQADGEELVKAGLTLEEEHLFRQAAELVKAKRFQQRGVRIRDLSFLKDLPQLKELDLWDNDIEDLTPLATLSGLRELWVPYNLISDLSPLAGLDKLVQLKVYGNQITSLEPLRRLTNLNVLDLRGNPLEPGALACLRKCKRLGMLDLSNTGLGDISGLEFCRAHVLDLQNNPGLTGLEVISTMKRLCCLSLDTEVARRYDVQTLAPQLIEYGELDGLSVYVWPEKYFN